MALELLSHGITVNSISPGMVDTTSFPKVFFPFSSCSFPLFQRMPLRRYLSLFCFSKDKGRPGVRSAESVKGAFMALIESGKSGKYIHVDEYDTAVAQGEKKIIKAENVLSR
jgi:NAD(P)-dependent dehydrogenase (short-subunit alcohol dehydrogenase family)